MVKEDHDCVSPPNRGKKLAMRTGAAFAWQRSWRSLPVAAVMTSVRQVVRGLQRLPSLHCHPFQLMRRPPMRMLTR